MAGPLMEGVKALTLGIFICHLKIKTILLYTTYRNKDISRQSLSVGIFTWLLQCFPTNRAILVHKLDEKNTQGGVGEALMANHFFAASLMKLALKMETLSV